MHWWWWRWRRARLFRKLRRQRDEPSAGRGADAQNVTMRTVGSQPRRCAEARREASSPSSWPPPQRRPLKTVSARGPGADPQTLVRSALLHKATQQGSCANCPRAHKARPSATATGAGCAMAMSADRGSEPRARRWTHGRDHVREFGAAGAHCIGAQPVIKRRWDRGRRRHVRGGRPVRPWGAHNGSSCGPRVAARWAGGGHARCGAASRLTAATARRNGGGPAACADPGVGRDKPRGRIFTALRQRTVHASPQRRYCLRSVSAASPAAPRSRQARPMLAGENVDAADRSRTFGAPGGVRSGTGALMGRVTSSRSSQARSGNQTSSLPR